MVSAAEPAALVRLRGARDSEGQYLTGQTLSGPNLNVTAMPKGMVESNGKGAPGP